MNFSVMVVLYLVDKSMVSSQIITQSSCLSFEAVPIDDFKPDQVSEFDLSELKRNKFLGEESVEKQIGFLEK